METLLILLAVAVIAISVVVVVRTMARARRPPLRLPHEDAMIEEENRLMDSLSVPPVSPIDRSAPVLDLEPIEPSKDRPIPPGSPAR